MNVLWIPINMELQWDFVWLKLIKQSMDIDFPDVPWEQRLQNKGLKYLKVSTTKKDTT